MNRSAIDLCAQCSLFLSIKNYFFHEIFAIQPRQRDYSLLMKIGIIGAAKNIGGDGDRQIFLVRYRLNSTEIFTTGQQQIKLRRTLGSFGGRI